MKKIILAFMLLTSFAFSAITQIDAIPENVYFYHVSGGAYNNPLYDTDSATFPSSAYFTRDTDGPGVYHYVSECVNRGYSSHYQFRCPRWVTYYTATHALLVKFARLRVTHV